MQTIVIDGKEYILVPKETVQPTITPKAPEIPRETQQTAFHGALSDFLDESPIDDGLATQNEKQEAIRVIDEPQTIIAPAMTVPKAQPRVHEYWRKFKDKELTPADVMTFSHLNRQFLASNPEDPMIKADQKKPKEQQLFYGPGTQQEGA